MKLCRLIVFVVPIVILSAAGCASAGSSSSFTPVSQTLTSSAPAAAPDPAPDPAPSSTPDPAPRSTAMCLTHSCVVQDMEQSLTGGIALDEAVATKVTCYESTVVFYKAADTYSATCTVDYSDGSSASGTGNMLVSQQKVTFEPSD